MTEFEKIEQHSQIYLSKIQKTEDDDDEFQRLTVALIEEAEQRDVVVPAIEESFSWLNASGKLSYSDNLKGKLCVMDFFTYCCINCMHILPDLHELEEKHSVEDGLLVLGVHSAKFQNEKVLSNILNAVLRYNITHPVVNDSDAILWNKMSIQCWPTLVVVSPQGKTLLYLVGEGHKTALFRFVDFALRHYKGKGLISSHKLPLQKSSLKESQFLFPGKLCLSPDEDCLAISDTGHHQIVIVDLNGMLMKKIGNGVAGLRGGSHDIAQFNSPQGLVWHEDCIYVADTENHSVRKISTSTWEVETLVGTGSQGNDRVGGKEGKNQDISSPWDVIVAPPPGSEAFSVPKTCLYISNAGTHQIWCYYLQDGCWIKNSTQKKGTCIRFAGSGNEENRNNSYPHKASFAQPSGLTLACIKDQAYIYVADSESSSVRWVEVKSGAVKACVGGERDPTNLFAYGDIDGKGIDAKLQHPLAVYYNKSSLYVADSYNHKIKIVDPTSLACSTIVGTGVAGHKDGNFLESELNEPGDVVCHSNGERVYVADTNNHCVRVLDMKTMVVSTLPVVLTDQFDAGGKKSNTKCSPLVNARAIQVNLQDVKCDFSKTNTKFTLAAKLNPDLHFTDEAESKWQIMFNEGEYIGNGGLNGGELTCVLPAKSTPRLTLKIELLLFVCSNDGVCLMKQYLLLQTLHQCNEGSSHARNEFNVN